MKKSLIIIFAIILVSCKKDDVNPSDESPFYSSTIVDSQYEFITAYQIVWSGNYSTGIPDIAKPSGSSWKNFKKYHAVVSRNTGDPYYAIVQIYWREYSGSGPSTVYSEPSIPAPDDSKIYAVECGNTGNDPLDIKVSDCISDGPVSTFGQSQYYPYAGESLFWKQN